MKKNSIFTFIVLLGFAACSPNPENKAGHQPKTTDAITGASNEAVTLLDISKEEGLTMVYDGLKKGGTYFLATVENNAPKVRPIGIVTNYEGKLWFHVGKHKASYEQIQKNPNIEIASIDSGGRCIRIYGKAVCIDNEAIDRLVFERYPYLKTMYNEESGKKLGHFYISNGIADIPTDSTTVLVKF
jgi:uncharacterized pyridoxamine 5'-phosphate oxidase family protein